MKKTLLALVLSLAFALSVGVGTAFAAPAVKAVDENGMKISGISVAAPEVIGAESTLVAPDPDGFYFLGWYATNDAKPAITTKPTADTHTWTYATSKYASTKNIFAAYMKAAAVSAQALDTAGAPVKATVGVYLTGSSTAEKKVPTGFSTEFKASDKTAGYIFRGWYEKTDTEKGYGALYSSNATFTVKVTRDLDLVAVYQKLKQGEKVKVDGYTYKISDLPDRKLTLVKAPNKKTVTVKSIVTLGGKKFKVTALTPKMFKGKKTTTLILQSKYLTKKGVKNSLKSSKVYCAHVNVNNMMLSKNYKYNNTYAKYFKKSNSGKSITMDSRLY